MHVKTKQIWRQDAALTGTIFHVEAISNKLFPANIYVIQNILSLISKAACRTAYEVKGMMERKVGYVIA